MKQYVLFQLKLGWSGEKIAGRIKKVSIRTFISGKKRKLKTIFKTCSSHPKKEKWSKTKKGKIPNRIGISLRPKDIETREEFGHWEGDSGFYKGHSQALAMYTERKTRFIVTKKVKDRIAKERVRLSNCYYSQLPLEARRTMTYNDSLEFLAHEEISSALGIKIYFARPSASFKRGRNENSNGLIHWYLSKDTDLDSLTEEELDAIIKLD